jgi:hypothetical protein
MGWPHREPSNPAILAATKNLVIALKPKKVEVAA